MIEQKEWLDMFTNEQIETVCNEIADIKDLTSKDSFVKACIEHAARLILQARAETEKVREQAFDGDVHLRKVNEQLRAERDVALSRVRELDLARIASQVENKRLREQADPRIAALEAENAKLHKYDLRRIVPFVPAERIAENERLPMVFESIQRGIRCDCVDELRAALNGEDNE